MMRQFGSRTSSPTCRRTISLHGRRRLLAGGANRRQAAASQALRQERSADPRQKNRRAKANARKPMACETRASRAADMVSRIAAADPSPAGERRRLGRSQKRDRPQFIPAAATESRRRGEGRTMARACPADLPRRGWPHHFLSRAPGAAPAREDQPWACARRPSGHRQGHSYWSRSNTRSDLGISPRRHRNRRSDASMASSSASCSGSPKRRTWAK